MIKMDMIWVAVAGLIYPEKSSSITVSRVEIESEVSRQFEAVITPVMIEKHLVCWVDRQADKENPRRGGSRNRYLFRTSNCTTPSSDGNYRLYKAADSKYDGWDKTERTCPDERKIEEKYHELLVWYKEEYFLSS